MVNLKTRLFYRINSNLVRVNKVEICSDESTINYINNNGYERPLSKRGYKTYNASFVFFICYAYKNLSDSLLLSIF